MIELPISDLTCNEMTNLKLEYLINLHNGLFYYEIGLLLLAIFLFVYWVVKK